MEEVREALDQAPLVRPRTPNGLPMRVRVSACGALGWVGDGAYRYDGAQADGRPWPPIPRRWRELADEVVSTGPMPWDSAIINWYDEEASLGWHQDQAEFHRSLPIVTVSLGDACSWAIRDPDGQVHRIRLESGAVTVLEGATRNWAHTVERIIAAPMFSPLKSRGRISVTLRVAGRMGP